MLLHPCGRPFSNCSFTGVISTSRVAAVGVAVYPYVMWFLILEASAVAIATACVGIDVLAIVALVCHLGNGCHQLLDLCFHRCNFVDGWCVCSKLIVGAVTCNLLGPFL